MRKRRSGFSPTVDGRHASATSRAAGSDHVAIVHLAAGRRTDPIRVLIVEDYPDVRDMFSLYLEHAGLEVATAVDGPSALAMLGGEPPDVVVVDLGLPEIDGWDVIGRMRADPRWCDVGIIAFTGYVQDAPLARARAVGADVVLTKPAGPQTLADAIASVSAARHDLRATSSRPPPPT